MNRFGIPADIERQLRTRDTRCVYCSKEFSDASQRDKPTIEHFNENPPFHWRDGVREGGLAICCWSCNSSRGQKTLPDWFRSPYCINHNPPIDLNSVAEPVRKYL